MAKLIAAVMLFAALGRHSYDYFTLLRWISCGVCAFTAFQAAEAKKNGWLWLLTITALILNPIVPLRLKRETRANRKCHVQIGSANRKCHILTFNICRAALSRRDSARSRVNLLS